MNEITNTNYIGISSNKQKEASKSNKELDRTPEPNFDLLCSEDDLEVDDNNSQGSVKGQVHESQSLFGGNESEIMVSGGKKRSLISQEAEKGKNLFQKIQKYLISEREGTMTITLVPNVL